VKLAIYRCSEHKRWGVFLDGLRLTSSWCCDARGWALVHEWEVTEHTRRGLVLKLGMLGHSRACLRCKKPLKRGRWKWCSNECANRAWVAEHPRTLRRGSAAR
jgi:hypothetical protein